MTRTLRPSTIEQRTAVAGGRGRGALALRGLALFALCGGCTAQITGDGASGGPVPGQPTVGAGTATGMGSVAGAGPVGAGTVELRRLNVAEYATTIKDWLGIAVDVSAFPPDGTTTAGFDTVAEALPVSASQVSRFKDSVTAVVDTLFAADPGGVRAKWCSCTSGAQAADEACAQQIVSGFAEQAWRRPHASWPAANGLTPYVGLLGAAGPLASFPLEQRLKQALRGVLLGPRFLLRVELTDPRGHLDVPSVAARLSYMLWSSAPDATTLQANLKDDAALRAEVRRMLFDGKAYTGKFERFLQRFPDIWLELGQVPRLNRDPVDFPKFTPALQAAMRAETLAFFRSFVGPDPAQAQPLSQLLSQDYPVTDSALAKLYGNSPRSGLLTQASVLSVTSVGTRTSAVRRGHWVLDRLLCDPPPPPPATVLEKINAGLPGVDQDAIERERLAQHRAEPQCAACHETMDVIGLGLENYDAIGEYRVVDAQGRPIEPSGLLPGSGQRFTSGVELASALTTDPRFVRCMAQQLLTYGTGRLYSSVDYALLDSIRTAAGGPDATFQRVLEAVVLSPAFRDSEGKIQ